MLPCDIFVISGVATQGDLDSLEGPRVPRTRGANESANGGTDGTPGAVGRWASVRRSEEDDKEVAARLATAWTTRVYGVVVVRYTFCRFKRSRRFAGCGRLRRDAPSPAAPALSPLSLLPPFPVHVQPTSAPCNPCAAAGLETLWTLTHRVATRRAGVNTRDGIRAITRMWNFVNGIDTFANKNFIFVST